MRKGLYYLPAKEAGAATLELTNPVLGTLIALQAIDDQAKQIRQSLTAMTAKLEEGRGTLKKLESKLATLKQELADMKAHHRDLEGQVADLSVKRANNEKRQLNVKSSTEYAALTKEAEFFASRIDELEDEILALLDRIEQREKEVAAWSQLVAKEGASFAQLEAATAQDQAAGQETLGGLGVRRGAETGSLPPNQLKHYEELIQTKGGRAVTAAAGGMCLACRLGFPPQFFNDLQRNEKILTCPNCGRIIYWQDHPDFISKEVPAQQ